jgi:hypothetical protein
MQVYYELCSASQAESVQLNYFRTQHCLTNNELCSQTGALLVL